LATPVPNEQQPVEQPPILELEDLSSTNQNDSTTRTQVSSSKLFSESHSAISEQFDKLVFNQISAVDHIQKTEQDLEEMKHTIKDKKRL